MMRLILAAACLVPLVAPAEPQFDHELLGERLGGWNAKSKGAAEYEITGASFRTWKPHVTPTVDGGLFVSVRIDHLRGLLASNDHASLELRFDKHGEVQTARSTIALQGRKITSDVIKAAVEVGGNATTADRMVKLGTDLVADLTAKLLREKVNEPGRVGFPAALQHNYHLLCLSVHPLDRKAVVVEADVPEAETGNAEEEPARAESHPAEEAAPPAPAPEESKREAPPLEIDVQGKPVDGKHPPLPLPER